MVFVLGIDLGTSYFKLGVFDRAGNLCGLGRVFVPKKVGDGSLCEITTEAFWSLLKQGIAEACQQAKIQPSEIEAMAYSSQANSFVLLNNNYQALTPLIVWPDQRVKRTPSVVTQLWQRDDFLQTTGNGGGYGRELCISKLCWYQKNHPQIWSATNHVMTISDYFTYCMTGQAVGDGGTAALLGIQDLKNLKWWNQALEILGLSESQLSEILRPGTAAGVVSSDGTARLGLKAGVPFAVGSLDHHVAAIGAGVGQIADMSESTGTVLACINFTNKYRPVPDRCIGPGVDEHDYYQLVHNANGAGALQWYQQHYAADLSIAELAGLAESVEIGSDGLIAKVAPDQYDGLNGFVGISDPHTHGHFVRAIMESTAASLAMLVENLYENKPKRIVATGGGAHSDLWLRIKADLTGVEFVTSNCSEPACKGAAMLASVAAKWFESIEDVSKKWILIQRVFKPNRSNCQTYAKWHKKYIKNVV